jgi:hypothetical protein
MVSKGGGFPPSFLVLSWVQSFGKPVAIPLKKSYNVFYGYLKWYQEAAIGV